jgi:hypothetical protein
MLPSDDPPQQVLTRRFNETLPNEPLSSTRAIIDREATGLVNLGTAYLLRAAVKFAPDYFDYRPNTCEQAMWISQHRGGIARLIAALLLLTRVVWKRQKVHGKRLGGLGR